jgi:large subunit ribosomal protein L21
MYAVIKTGGKQYRVAADDVIVVEKLGGEDGDMPVGAKCVFEDVLLVSKGDKVEIGAPLVKGAKVSGEIVEQRRAPKVLMLKTKPRNTYRRRKGHRQHETVVKITGIVA